MNKALDDSAPVLFLCFAFPSFRELRKQKFDLLCSDYEVGGSCDRKLSFKSLFFIFELLQSRG